MFSALKRLTGRNEGAAGSTPPSRHGLQSMSHNLQRKFARGVQYNSKYDLLVTILRPLDDDVAKGATGILGKNKARDVKNCFHKKLDLYNSSDLSFVSYLLFFAMLILKKGKRALSLTNFFVYFSENYYKG